jgi:uncharacterized membrane protein YqgA involved in biofilm formation
VIPGLGTVLNVVTVLVGATVGTLLGHRIPDRAREVVTDALGLVTLLVGALTAVAVRDPAFVALVGPSGPVLVLLGGLALGGLVGALLRLEERLDALGAALHRRLVPTGHPTLDPTGHPTLDPTVDPTGDPGHDAAAAAGRRRFIDGFVTASLVFCVGPLTILGSISDGLGLGIEQLALKSVLDGFAAMAFAATFGWGVAASAITVAVVQGSLTLLGVLVGDALGPGVIAAMSAAGGLLLVGLGLRLLRVRAVPVADLLPALLVTPVLALVVAELRP